MNGWLKGSLLVFSGLLAAQSAVAGWYSGGDVDSRHQRQQHRIERGVEAGDLTRREARKLRRELRDIGKQKRRYEDDGWLSRRERRSLDRRYDDLSQQIARLRHNDIRRHARHGRYRHQGHDEYFLYRYPDYGRRFGDDDRIVRRHR